MPSGCNLPISILVPKKKDILLISNFRSDQQHSMLRFRDLLMPQTPKRENLNIHEIYPSPLVYKLFKHTIAAKWAAYFDKYFLFPKTLKNILANNTHKFELAHIIDQSNSPYLKTIHKISSANCLITCHDMIAIRTALGELPEAPQTSLSGKRLQSWIQNSLSLADFYACDSYQTICDLNRIVPSSRSRSEVIHLGVNFNAVNLKNQSEFKSELSFKPASTRFILHVGSAAWYKNRIALFQAFQNAKKQSQFNDLKLVLVGPPPQEHEINPNLKKWIEKNSGNIFWVNHVSDETLNELYLHAAFLIFPSLIEGFGWPPLEAASNGCSVITTKTGAIHDLLGRYANYVNPSEQDSINLAVINLLEQRNRTNKKISLPADQECRENYYNLYRKLLKI